MQTKVFVRNEAASNREKHHDEKTLEYNETNIVSRAYLYPYGFMLDTNADDSCKLEVFVITKRRLTTGQILECEAIGVMEQLEDEVQQTTKFGHISLFALPICVSCA